VSDDRHNREIWAEHRHVRGQLLPWPQDQSTLDLLDTKTIQLAACTTAGTDFVRTGMRPVKWTGSAKCADLQKIIEEGPGDYIFTQTLPAQIAPAVANLLTLLRLIKSASCNVNDPLARPHLASLKEKVTILVCQYERFFPRSEVCRVSHIVLHVCDVVQRWNSVRNFWCFLTERSKLSFTVVTGSEPVVTDFGTVITGSEPVVTGSNCVSFAA